MTQLESHDERAKVEGLGFLSVQALDARIERLEHLTQGRYGTPSKREQARYTDELEAARAEWSKRFRGLEAAVGEGRR